jgi:hypothetical protein
LKIGRSQRVPNPRITVGGEWQTFCFWVKFSSVQTLTRCCFWSAVRLMGTNLVATRRMPNSSVRTRWHVSLPIPTSSAMPLTVPRRFWRKSSWIRAKV